MIGAVLALLQFGVELDRGVLVGPLLAEHDRKSSRACPDPRGFSVAIHGEF
jgi:hypothetical protein